MGRLATDEGASRAAQSALLNLPKGANAKAKQHHHSMVMRKRIEYSNRYASCLKSCHLLDDQACQQRTTQNSNILSCLLSGFKSKVADGARTRRLGKLRVRPLKPISAFYADTFFTCTFLLLVTCALVSLLLSFEAASASASAVANHHQHHHNHNEISHQSVYHHLGRHHRQKQQQHELEGERQPSLGRDSRPVSDHRRSRAQPDEERRRPDQTLEQDSRAAPSLERDTHSFQQIQRLHSDHPHRPEHKHGARTRVNLGHRQHPMRFGGFVVPHRATSFNLSEPNFILDSDDEFDSYNVDDVFKDDDDDDDDDDEDHDDDQLQDLDDSDKQLEDEDDEAENEIDLDVDERKSLHLNQRHETTSNRISNLVAPAAKHRRQMQAHPSGLELHQTEHRKRGASRPVQASGRRHELPKPRVPYQTPVVVSISDSSFVSASPVVLPSGGSSSGGDQQAVAGSAAGEEMADSEPGQLTTSTTATTTREPSTGEALEGSSGELGLELEEKVGREAGSTLTTFGAPIVLGNSNRYNYIVSDLERPRRPANGRQTREQEQQARGLEASASLEMQLPRTRSRTMQTSEPNVDPAPTVGTLSVLEDQADGNLDLDDSANDIDSLEDDDDDDVDDDDVNDDDVNDHDGQPDDAGQEVEVDARFARASKRLDEFVRKSLGGVQSTSGKYSHLIVNPPNELPSYGRRHLASIRMIQEDPNEFQRGGVLNGAIIAILSGIGVTGVLVLIVSVKMRSIRERIAHKGRRRSLVPDADFLINTIPI